MRAFSHGCVRLQQPREMAAAVLGKSVDYVAERLKQGHSSEKITRKIPVYVAYFTAWPNSSGKIEYFADVYERDMRLKAAVEKTDALRLPAGAIDPNPVSGTDKAPEPVVPARYQSVEHTGDPVDLAMPRSIGRPMLKP